MRAPRPYRIVLPRPSSKFPKRSKTLMAVSRNRSCCSSRTRFFLYRATYILLASPYGELRSSECMISETSTLMGVTKSCQATLLSTSSEVSQPSECLITRAALAQGTMERESIRREVVKSHQMTVMKIPREQSKPNGCLRVCLAGEGFLAVSFSSSRTRG